MVPNDNTSRTIQEGGRFGESQFRKKWAKNSSDALLISRSIWRRSSRCFPAFRNSVRFSNQRGPSVVAIRLLERVRITSQAVVRHAFQPLRQVLLGVNNQSTSGKKRDLLLDSGWRFVVLSHGKKTASPGTHASRGVGGLIDMNNVTLRNLRQQSILKEAGRTRLSSKSITAKTSTGRSHCNHRRSYNKNTAVSQAGILARYGNPPAFGTFADIHTNVGTPHFPGLAPDHCRS